MIEQLFVRLNGPVGSRGYATDRGRPKRRPLVSGSELAELNVSGGA
jgi:hypothetical protein